MQLPIATLFALATALSVSAGFVPLAERGSETGVAIGSGSVHFNTLVEGGAEIQFFHDANRGGHVANGTWNHLYFSPSDQGLDKWLVNTRGNATKTYIGKVNFVPILGEGDTQGTRPKVSP
jgi:hypothetical protein